MERENVSICIFVHGIWGFAYHVVCERNFRKKRFVNVQNSDAVV
ncbi:Uncharacterised protein [Chlamydia trachomatis]|nr:Uncharacterised protein [Chlamydia trachomatis]